jgi:hypothetical protein
VDLFFEQQFKQAVSSDASPAISIVLECAIEEVVWLTNFSQAR